MQIFKLLLLLTIVPFGSAAAEGLNPSDFWRTFRKTSPLPLQDIIASPISPSGEAVVILTEPPAQVWHDRQEIIGAMFGDKVVAVEVHAYPVGYDGWIKDIVVRLRDIDEAALSQGVADLSKAFFGTTYGASYRTFEPHGWDELAAPKRHLGPPNLEISAASLNNWLFESPQTFVDRTANEEGAIDGRNADPVALSNLFDQSRTGVFYGSEPGLVLLVLDRNKSLNEIQARLRQFCVDSDALLGAVSQHGSSLLILIGRERTASISDTPPLRTDTILTLAAATEENLAQSYERNAPLAGPTSDPQLGEFLNPRAEGSDDPGLSRFPQSVATDWAPILLSRELTNTEYGQLLNITDQMLKGWSMANLIAYANFPYPAPAEFPNMNGIFDRLQSEFGSSFSDLTFNWNTAGFGVWTEFGKYEIFSILNSNALPISYIPDVPDSSLDDDKKREIISAAEDEYGRYFAEQWDPYLNRVAQYAALHVIFTRYPVHATRTEPLVPEDAYDHRWDALKSEVGSALRKLMESSDAQDSSMAPSASQDEATENDTGQSCGTDAILAAVYTLTMTNTWDRLNDLAAEYARDDTRFAQLVDAMVDPKGFGGRLSLEFARMYAEQEAFSRRIDAYNGRVRVCNALPASSTCQLQLRAEYVKLDEEKQQLTAWQKELEEKRRSLQAFVEDGSKLMPLLPLTGDCTIAWQGIHKAVTDPTDSVYKTPSIVVSTVVNGLLSGGHNLDGRSIEVIGDANVPVGSLSIDKAGDLLRLNPADLSKSTTIAREFERSRITFLKGGAAAQRRIEQRIAAKLKADTAPLRPFTAATLGRAEGSPTARGLGTDASRHIVGTYPMRVSAKQLKDAAKLAEETQANLVAGFEDGVFTLIDPGPPPVGVATSSPANMLRLVEAKAAEAAASADNAAGGYVVVSNGSLSLAELDGIRIAGETRQLIAAVGGGGKPPIESRMGMFFEKGPREPGGNGPVEPGGTGRGGHGGGDWLAAFPFGRNARNALTRTDADWTNATLDTASVSVTADGESIVGRLRIAFKTKETPMVVRLKAYFSTRPAEPADADVLKAVVGQELADVADGTMIGTKLLDIKRSFNKEMKGAARLRARLQQDDLDFIVVEIVPDVQLPERS